MSFQIAKPSLNKHIEHQQFKTQNIMKKSDIKFKVDHQILVKFLKMTIKIGEIDGKSAMNTKAMPNNFDGNINQIPHNDILSLVIEDLVGEIKIGRDMNQLKTPTAISVDAKMSRL